MEIKNYIKSIIANIDYFLHEIGIIPERIQVYSIDDTIDELLETKKSLVRFGDGEINIIRGRDNATQTSIEGLAERLIEILNSDDDMLMVTIPDIFDDLKAYRASSRKFWKDHILMSRKTYHKYCKPERIYFNTSFSRNYYAYIDRSVCDKQNAKIKQIWKDKEIIVIEGASTHNGVGNDLLDSASKISRIIGPSTNAFEKYDDILAAGLEAAKSRNPDNLIFLISLGAAAKPLAYDLFQKGYRVIDIGNLDMEYEWFLMHAEGKEKLRKHSVLGEDANRQAGYNEYLNQIITYVGNKD